MQLEEVDSQEEEEEEDEEEEDIFIPASNGDHNY